MAALAADASRKTKNRGNVKIARYAVATGEVIYKGALCAFTTTSSRLVAASNAVNRKFVGLARETKTGNTGGTVYAHVEWNIEALVNAATALTDAYIGSNAAASTDNDVTTASGAGTSGVQVLVGEIVEFESGDAWVSLRNYAEAQS